MAKKIDYSPVVHRKIMNAGGTIMWPVNSKIISFNSQPKSHKFSHIICLIISIRDSLDSSILTIVIHKN